MTHFPQRKRLRLPHYDYSQNGAYFITICIKDHKHLLGTITDNAHGEKICQLSSLGKTIEKIWHEMPQYYSSVELDVFQIMPNHIHGIICLGTVDGPAWEPAPTQRLNIPQLIYRFKSLTTKLYNDGIGDSSSNKKLWQRNYYEHVVRNEADWERIREYIVTNPYTWDKDEYFVFERDTR